MGLINLLGSCVEQDGKIWLVRTEGCIYKGREETPAAARYKAYLRAAQHHCHLLNRPSVVSSVTAKGDAIQSFNEAALNYLGLSRQDKQKSLLYSSRDFWQNLADYWEYRMDLIQKARAEARVQVLDVCKNPIGELIVVAQVVSQDSPIFLVRPI